MNCKEYLMMRNQLFNRKVLFSLLAVVMCLGFTAMSYGQVVVSVEPAEIESPAVGEELTVSVNITGGAGVAGYQVTVNFDPTALSYVSSAYNAEYLAPFPGVSPDGLASDSTIQFFTLGSAPDGDGTIGTVTFEVVEVKASTISLSDVTISGAGGTSLESTIMDSMVTVAGAEAPAEETPAEETPAEETPAEEAVPEMPVSQMFEITLTNLTMGEAGMGGQILSPPIFAAHPAGVRISTVGEAASEALVLLAENGDTSGLAAIAAAAGANVAMADGMVPPGGSVTVTVTADIVNSALSIASMLVSTNDAFIVATDVALFDEDGAPVSADLELIAYDAGSEDNTEMASDIPGPLGLDAAVDPEGSNERVPTVDGVIAAHEGIQGGAEVADAFAWEEPTAMLTITPVAAPVAPEPMPEPMPEPVVPGFDVTLGPGLNMVSVPLMPEDPYTAKSLAEMLGATVVIQLNAATQSFDGYTVADGGDGFDIEGGKGYIVNTPAGAMVKFTGSAWDNQPEPEPPAEDMPEDMPEDMVEDMPEDMPEDMVEDMPEDMPEDMVEDMPEDMPEEAAADDAAANGAAADDAAADDAAANGAADAAPAAPALSTFRSAWAFIVTSDINGMETGTNYTLVAENLRTGTLASENITTGVRRSSAVWADLNRKSVVEAGDKLEIALYDDRGRVVSGPFQRTVTTTDIRNAFLSLDLTVGDVRPQETILAQNYPNPFNPETWIPYQLSESTEVSIQIYDVSGRLVRTLDLGWQPVGSYMTPSSAAYWDGRNAVGERVASGIYFYTLQTSDFAATRRMVILK